MLKILQARFQQYVNHELPDVQAGFRKGRRTRDQIVNICWIIEKAREFQKNINFCFIDYAKAFDSVDHTVTRKALFKKVNASIPHVLTFQPGPGRMASAKKGGRAILPLASSVHCHSHLWSEL